MVSNDHTKQRIDIKGSNRLRDYIRYLHLMETDTYRQRLQVAKNIEKHRKKAIRELNQIFHDSFQFYELRWHKQAKDIRELREYLEELANFEYL